MNYYLINWSGLVLLIIDWVRTVQYYWLWKSAGVAHYTTRKTVNNARFCTIRTALNTVFLRVTRGFYGVCYQDGVFDGVNTVLNAAKNGVLYVNAIYL